MCSRYTLATPEQILEIVRIAQEAEERLRARNSRNVRAHLSLEDIRPTQLAPVLFPHNGRLASAPAFWGFTNSHGWENRRRAAEGKKPLKPTATYNARDDKLEASAFWRESFHRRRCIIPAAAFEEWAHGQEGGRGTPYYFTPPGSPVLYIAGIWQNEADDSGERWPHYSLVTTAPGSGVAGVHSRMPLVILPDEFDAWLHEDYHLLLTRTPLELDKRLA